MRDSFDRFKRIRLLMARPQLRTMALTKVLAVAVGLMLLAPSTHAAAEAEALILDPESNNSTDLATPRQAPESDVQPQAEATLHAEGELNLTAEKPAPNERWGLHFQATTVTQGDDSNEVPPYEQPGANGLSGAAQVRTSFTSTLFLGARLVPGLEFYVDPEISAGSGLSDTHGIGAFPNGEIYRVDSPNPKLYLARLYLRYILGRGGETQNMESDQHQIATTYDENRATVVFGKFSLNDFFDGNRYAHDPRTQFLNWLLMDNGAWDYAADTRGYTWGVMLEWNQTDFAVRFASVLEPTEANQLALDTDFTRSRGDNLELEYRYQLIEHPGKLRLLAYVNHANMGSYAEALGRVGFKTVDITQSRASRTKYGVGVNLEQEITEAWGVFGRAGWNDGQTESWAFTEVDATASIGLVWKPFTNREDRWGAAVIGNALSPQHRRYLEAGGRGFILGEGGLNYGLEEVIETYYLVAVCDSVGVSGDFQLVSNAGYNQDRAGVSIYALRLHAEF